MQSLKVSSTFLQNTFLKKNWQSCPNFILTWSRWNVCQPTSSIGKSASPTSPTTGSTTSWTCQAPSLKRLTQPGSSTLFRNFYPKPFSEIFYRNLFPKFFSRNFFLIFNYDITRLLSWKVLLDTSFVVKKALGTWLKESRLSQVSNSPLCDWFG